MRSFLTKPRDWKEILIAVVVLAVVTNILFR